jgi:hypothetical protein
MLDNILKVIDKWVPDREEAQRLKVEMEKNFNDYSRRDHELRLKEFEHKGFKSWWRPALMTSFGTIVVSYCFLYYIMPALVVYFQIESLEFMDLVEPDVNPALWDLVKYSILGIGGMRTVDKWKKS